MLQSGKRLATGRSRGPWAPKDAEVTFWSTAL